MPTRACSLLTTPSGRPMKPLTEFTTNDNLVHLGGDRWVRDNDPIFDDETVEKIRLGYICIECFQRFESAFPEKCPFPICGFPVRAEQSLMFLKKFKGVDPDLWRYKDPEPLEERLRKG